MTMFWVGAMMALAPILFAAIVIGTWWVQRKRRGAANPRPGTGGSPG